GSGTGRDATNFLVYSSCGVRMTSTPLPDSTNSPWYKTPTVCETMSITARSWEINSAAKPNSSCSDWKIYKTTAWTETSSAEVGSSAITSSGLSTNPLASDTRWR